METCFYGMESIVSNSPNGDLLEKRIIEDLKGNSFKVERIHLIKVLNSFGCDVFTTDSKGVRRYSLSLAKNGKYPHSLKVVDIREKKVNSRYQL